MKEEMGACLQNQAIDAQAMSFSLAACLVAPLAKLNRHKPADRMCTVPAMARIAMIAVALICLDISYTMYLVTRPWFTGGTGTAYMVSTVCHPLGPIRHGIVWDASWSQAPNAVV